MSFKPENVNAFKQVFGNNWKFISGFEGCQHVELLQDKLIPTVFFTFSIWQSEEHLDAYRQSELFKRVWGDTKALFNDKPQAWSVSELSFD